MNQHQKIDIIAKDFVSQNSSKMKCVQWAFVQKN